MLIETILPLLIGVAAMVVGGGLGWYLGQKSAAATVQMARKDAERITASAQAEQKDVVLQATKEAMRLRGAIDDEVRERRQELQRQERRFTAKEEQLDRKVDAVERRDKGIAAKESDLEAARRQLDDIKRSQLAELERVSGMTTTEARELLLRSIDEEARQDANRRLYQIEQELRANADRRARELIIQSIQRCLSEVVSEVTVSVVPIPSDDMKGRIIGREGRNIRALENATGVDVIIDDTPDCVTLSCFDPVRREIARLALTKLVTDGRIHPTRIEEVVTRAKTEVDEVLRREGEQAVYDAGISGLHPELIKVLGRLKFRYSYGQNVLRHSVAVARIAGIIAAEMGANVDVCKRGGLLHEVEGPHAVIGARVVERYERPEVVTCVEKHHDDWFTNTLEGVIVQTADAISGGRPGARGESLENYVQRLKALEAVANSFHGVEKSYAVQAGREVRILVKPEQVDDVSAMRLARDIARKIEDSLEYPGQIKVTVVREVRAIEYAQ
ncbi:MAG: ribonuclease Y [Chloroflexi bacterium]|nr:ribonuclease Y [Chloroflexota bacterium]